MRRVASAKRTEHWPPPMRRSTPKGLLPADFKFLRRFCSSLLSFAYRCQFESLDARASAFLCIPLFLFARKPSRRPSQAHEARRWVARGGRVLRQQVPASTLWTVAATRLSYA